VEVVESRPLCSLPDRAFCRFAVTHENENPLIRMIEPFRMGGDRHTHRQTLTERTGRYVHKRQQGGRVSFQIRVDLAQSQQSLTWQGTSFRPCGIEDRRRMTLR